MKNLLILFILAFSCNCMAGNNEPAHVIITAGQSNTDGRVPNDRLPDYIKTMATDTAFTTGAYKYCRIAQNRTDGKFRPFWPKSKRRAKPNTWGYDAITYYWLEQWWQEPFYVIKWAIGGTSIEPSNASDKSIHWSANPEWLANNTATSEKGRSLLLSLCTQPSKRKNRKRLLQPTFYFRYGSQEEQTVWQRSGSRHETFC